MRDIDGQADAGSRQRIATDLGSTLFVEAGAGSGKTTALVDRVLRLVVSGEVELRNIAAITFTDKAASELRDRIRRVLEDRTADPAAAEPILERCRLALDQLDGAAIGTLHSFARRLLSEHPVEAGLPPRVEVLDEVSSGVGFERRWSVLRDELLADPALERTILLLLACGVRVEALRVLAQAFDDNWDLVEEQVPVEEPEPPSVHELLRPAFDAISAVCASPCRDANDKLRLRLDEIAARAKEVAAIADEIDLLEALGPNASPPWPSFRVGNLGKKASYDCDIRALRAEVADAGDMLDRVRAQVSSACAHRLGTAVRRFTLAAASERQRAGELEFHDLLVLARGLLRHPLHGPGVRARLHERYQRLLLDEFQDTDPIQMDLAVRIASANPNDSVAGSGSWEAVPLAPGRLFVVGDPKQSIYRFRRADISTFAAAAARLGPEGGGVVKLTTNFRTVAPIIDWVNTTFAGLMSGTDNVGRPSGPAYVPLEPVRSIAGNGPAVAVLGRSAHPARTQADDLRAAEADEVATVVVRAIHEGWAVEEPRVGWRPARLGDVTILVPSRTSLPFLEDALDRVGVPFRAESSSLVYASRAVRDLLMVLRAVDDPTDHLRITAALRTPLLGCGDDDLFRFRREHNGHWNYLARQPPSLSPDDPVRSALDYLAELHSQRHWMAPSEMLDHIARHRRAFELGFVEGRPRDVWRRLRFVIDQARAWTESTGGTLREYLRWVGQQTAEGARVAESVLPESDDDAVRIMTIHAAKGLEFPITILSGLTTVPSTRRAAAQVVFPGRVGYRLGSQVRTEEYNEWLPLDEQMSHEERIRLLYVGCTRARDHLVVSLHRKARSSPPEPTRHTNAEVLLDGMGSLVDELADGAGDPVPLGSVAATPAEPPVALSEWANERSQSLRRARRPTAVAATALTEDGGPDAGASSDPGLRKRPQDLDLPPWMKGRYGTAVGRAVHGALQTIDLATGAGLDAAVAAQCHAEAVADREQDVRRLVLAALGSPSVRQAAAGPHWRELYVCAPLGDRLLEGYVDLLYRGHAGLVIVDHKTAATSDPKNLDRRVLGYRLQGASYALAVAATAGEPVERVTFVFLTPDGAIERHLDDLPAAVHDVTALVAAGQERIVD